ncbi:MAG: hypothetical protein Q9M39_04820 [Sulfurovum sp.]|nr:hypothetical protein [Sulfurovum sp.]
MNTAAMVKNNKSNLSSTISDAMSLGIYMGPYIMAYKNNGSPKAKHISKILLPKALDTASS